MALTATTTTLLTQRKVDIEAGITRNNTSGHSQAFELFLIEYLLGNIGGASIAGGVTVDNSGIETRLGNTTDPAADTGDGSLNALIKAVRDDVDNLSSLYGSTPTQAASATGDLMQRLRAIAENTQSAGSTALQAVTYDLVDGATGLNGIRLNGFIYASVLNALTDTSPITPGAATGNATNIVLVSDSTPTPVTATYETYTLDGTLNTVVATPWAGTGNTGTAGDRVTIAAPWREIKWEFTRQTADDPGDGSVASFEIDGRTIYPSSTDVFAQSRGVIGTAGLQNTTQTVALTAFGTAYLQIRVIR